MMTRKLTLVKCLCVIALSFASTYIASWAEPMKGKEAREPTTPLSSLEDEVAKQFDSIRQRQSLPRLERIGNTKRLRELVCTAGMRGKPPEAFRACGTIFYSAANPDDSTPKLEQIALYDAKTKSDHSTFRVQRYAVAVWPVETPGASAKTYWIGIDIFMSPFGEFFDNNLTDTIHYKNLWKEEVADACRSIK